VADAENWERFQRAKSKLVERVWEYYTECVRFLVEQKNTVEARRYYGKIRSILPEDAPICRDIERRLKDRKQ